MGGLYRRYMQDKQKKETRAKKVKPVPAVPDVSPEDYIPSVEVPVTPKKSPGRPPKEV